MPGRLFLSAPVGEVAAHFAAAIGLEAAAAEFAAGGEVPAVVAAEGGRRLCLMRWGLIPMGRTDARGRPVLETIVNARSETLFSKSAFAGLGRCLVPASGWYEWTGERRRRVRWAIRAREAPIIAIAAVWDLWRAPGGREVASLATVTCAPTAEVAPVHERMPLVLPGAAWPGWLGEAPGDPAALGMVPADGTFLVEPG